MTIDPKKFHRYTITSEDASPGYFRLVEDPNGAWVTWAEVESNYSGAREVTGWHCACGHPNGINLAVCACCGRSPGGDNPVTTIYRS